MMPVLESVPESLTETVVALNWVQELTERVPLAVVEGKRRRGGPEKPGPTVKNTQGSRTCHARGCEFESRRPRQFFQ